MEQLKKVFESIGELSESNQQIILESIYSINVKAKTRLQDIDKTADKIYLLEKGAARAFYYKEDKDITYWISTEGEFVGSVASFFTRQASTKMVETIEDSELWVFDYHVLETLFDQNLQLSRAGRLFSNFAVAMMEERFDQIHFKTAAERYSILLKTNPELINRIPLNYLASFLGITQETLSRIRSKQ